MQQEMSHPARRNILLVDDDQIILDTLGYGLEKASYVVTQCRSARDALAAYSGSPPDLAVLDIGLPDMRGTALAEQLLALRYRPILILSGHSEPEWVGQAISSGAIGYHVKPLTPSQLTRASRRRWPDSAISTKPSPAHSATQECPSHSCMRSWTVYLSAS